MTYFVATGCIKGVDWTASFSTCDSTAERIHEDRTSVSRHQQGPLGFVKISIRVVVQAGATSRSLKARKRKRGPVSGLDRL